MKFHVNPDSGNVGPCSARAGNCPFGDEQLHFPSERSARVFAEELMRSIHEERGTSVARGKLIIYVGVPGSGKSTLAAKRAQELSATVLNRDDTRTELFGESYHRRSPDSASESRVSRVLDEKLTKVLLSGGTAIDDNTNTNPRFLRKLVARAHELGAQVEIISVNTPLEEAKRRNRQRGKNGGRFVPEHVIDKMAESVYSEDGNIKDVVFDESNVFFLDKHTEGMRLLDDYAERQSKLYPVLSRDLVIVDIDGTLAFNAKQLEQHITNPSLERKDWKGFFEASVEAPVNSSVLGVLQRLRASELTIFAITGRQDDAAEHTIRFLERTEAPISRALMARAGDFRGDYATKNHMLTSLEQQGFRVVHSIDDRPRSIRVWEEKGILVSRVPEPLLDSAGEPLEPLINTFIGEGFCLKCGLELELNRIIHDSCRSSHE